MNLEEWLANYPSPADRENHGLGLQGVRESREFAQSIAALASGTVSSFSPALPAPEGYEPSPQLYGSIGGIDVAPNEDVRAAFRDTTWSTDPTLKAYREEVSAAYAPPSIPPEPGSLQEAQLDLGRKKALKEASDAIDRRVEKLLDEAKKIVTDPRVRQWARTAVKVASSTPQGRAAKVAWWIAKEVVSNLAWDKAQEIWNENVGFSLLEEDLAPQRSGVLAGSSGFQDLGPFIVALDGSNPFSQTPLVQLNPFEYGFSLR